MVIEFTPGLLALFVALMVLLIPYIMHYYLLENGVQIPFDMDFLLDRICMPLVIIILCLVAGRFLWRICFIRAGIGVEKGTLNMIFTNK